MHVLIVHPDPRVYRELLSVVQTVGSAAYARTLEAARDQIAAQPPHVIVVSTSAIEERTGSHDFLDLLSAAPHDVSLIVTSATLETLRTGPEHHRLSAAIACLGGDQPQRRARYRQAGQLRIDLARQRASLSGEWLKLPRLQFYILRYLMEHRGELVSHQELLKAVWGYDSDATEARELLKVHLRQIRRKLGPDFLPYLQTVRGEGYVFVDPQEEEEEERARDQQLQSHPV
jgi:two-component system KDP operon response regulator KdpE